MRRIILFELNEVPFRVLDAFVASRPQSTMAKLLDRSRQWITFTEDEVQLDPWISWPTLHRGVIDRQHEIFHLGQPTNSADERFPPIWKILAREGKGIGVFGSLHTGDPPTEDGHYRFYVPDYFSVDARAYPEHLGPFQELNLQMTRQSARNVSRRIPVRELLRFGISIPSLGIRPNTLMNGATQLVSEVVKPELKIRRRNYQTRLMGDAFVRLLERERPDFASFYTNNVAASMHRYWAALFPEDYARFPLAKGWRDQYRNEIFVALDTVDDVLARLVDFVVDDQRYCILLASSMGQGPIDIQPTSKYLTIVDTARFVECLGVAPAAWAPRPAMAPCVGIVVTDEKSRARLRGQISSFRIGDKTMRADARPLQPMTYHETSSGFFSFYVQIDNYEGPPEVQIGSKRLPLADAGIGFIPHEDGVNCTAQHVSQGAALLFDPLLSLGGSDRPEISTLDLAPSMLANYGVSKPSYMRGSPHAMS